MEVGREIHVSNRVVFPGETGAGGLDELIAYARDPNVPVIRIGSANEHLDISPENYRRDGNIEEPEGGNLQGNVSSYRLRFPEFAYDLFYKGISNSFHWPLNHARLDFVRETYGHEPSNFNLERFQREIAAADFICEQFAQHIIDEINPRPNDTIIVHDYQLTGLGACLRQGGFFGNMGHYLHTPAPSHEIWEQLNPIEQQHVKKNMLSLYAYDLVGVQAARDFRNIWRLIGPGSNFQGDPKIHTPYRMERRDRNGDWHTRSTWMSIMPVAGHDRLYEKQAEEAQPDAQRFLAEMGFPQPTILTWGRLDYSKGLVNQNLAIDLAIKFGLAANQVCFLQQAAMGREGIPAYDREFEAVTASHKQLVSDHGQNGLQAKLWTEKVDRRILLAIARNSRVGLITPLIDGYNLTAREYVAAQDPNNPGVLILGSNAGVADVLSDKAALKVDATDPRETASRICEAFDMSIQQRKEMWKRARQELGEYTNDNWQNYLIMDTQRCRQATMNGILIPVLLRNAAA